MATIKSYTDIEQSRKLAEILPLESADNYYSWHDERYYVVNKDCPYPYSLKEKIPCWSLAALLSVIPNYKLNSEHNYHTCTAGTNFGNESVDGWYDNPIDACVKMIIKLNEKNLL